MMMRRSLSVVFVVALTVVACKEEIPGPSVDKLTVNVLAVESDSADKDPYSGVAFVRVAVEGDGISTDKFVQYAPGGGPRLLEAIPFGTNLRLTIEGWSQAAQGGLGDLVSRGRSGRFRRGS